MLYGTRHGGMSSKLWLESNLKTTFETLNVIEVETLLSEFKKTMKISREILGENPFRRNNLFSGRRTKLSKIMLEPVAYIFMNLRKKYSNAKLIEKQTELVSAWDEFMSFENDGGETILENLQPTHGACNSSKHSRSEVRVFAAEEE